MNETIIHLWQSVATTCIGIIVTMMGFWIAIGKNMATKAEVLSMIETQGPYLIKINYFKEKNYGS